MLKRFGERGTVLSKMKFKLKGSFFIKIYFAIIIFLISFFTIFAFRYDVIDLLIKQNLISNKIDEKIIDSIQSKVSEIDANNKNIDKIEEIISKEIGDYAFQIVNYGPETIEIEENGEITEIQPIGTSFIYYYYPDGMTPSKHLEGKGLKHSLQFKNSPAYLFLYPRFSEFLTLYKVVALCLSIIITTTIMIIVNFIDKRKWLYKINNKLKEKKPFSLIRRLSTKLILINIIAIVGAVSIFMFMYINKYAFFDFARESKFGNNDYTEILTELRDFGSDINMSKKNHKKISKVLNKYTKDNDFYLYDENGQYYEASLKSEVANYFIRGSVYDVSALYRPQIRMFAVPFKDQTGLLVVYNYELINLLVPYMVVIFLISFSIYVLILLSFIRNKVFEIKHMQEDVSILANGDWKYEVRVGGNDEISELGNHLNQMRLSFLENMENEKAARSANKELISAMSHDLRTPLTTLNGYLEIVQLEKANKEKRDEYIARCLNKVEEIRDLSNKMFEYSLVFSAEDNSEMQKISIEKICEFLQDHIQYLRVLGFNIQDELVDSKQIINGNVVMLKRVFNNLFSNLQKYADPNQKINVSLSISKNAIKLVIFNHKKKQSHMIESNGIGLKSVCKIVDIHNGECYINDNENDFMIIITLPMNGGN